MILVYILGTDGSGKTTLARQLAAQTFAGHRVTCLYCQHRPFLLWMLKLPARLLFMRNKDQFASYQEYKRRKDSVSSKRPWLTRLYALMWYLDVWLQTWPRLFWARRKAVVVLDRYYLDWVVNAGVLLGNSLAAMLHDARVLERTLPRAQMYVFLDVSEETAFQRKSDIQSVQYLRERRERYLQLAPHYRFHIVDANQNAEMVFQQVCALVTVAVAPAAAPVVSAPVLR